MTLWRLVLGASALLIFYPAALAVADISPQKADTVLQNGRIYTVDAARSWVDALAINEGVIIAAGSDQDIQMFVGEETEIVDLEGRMAMPGFVDSHVHSIQTGQDRNVCILPGTFDNPGLTEFSDALKACDQRVPGNDLLLGFRFTISAIPEAKLNRHFLDELIDHRPVLLKDEAGHTYWLNSRALALSGVTADTKVPDGGQILRDEQGDLSGVLQSAAGSLLTPLLPTPPDDNELISGIAWSQRHMAEKGITAAMEAIVKPEDLPLWKSALDQLPVHPRMHLCLWVGNNTFEPPPAKTLRDAFEAVEFDEDTKICAKVYADMVLEAGTAALLEPYANRNHTGSMNFEPKDLRRIISDLDTHQIPIKTHAVGDRANREVLDAYAQAINRREGNPLRHHLAHLTAVHPQDFPRLRQLDVPGEFIGNVAALIPYVERSYYPALGHERFHAEMEPVGGLLAAGAIINASSDWGAAILDPMRSIQTVITRRDPHNPKGPIAGPKHRIDLPTAIAVHTIYGAYVLGREKQTGSLEVGKQADLIVLDRNLFEIPVEEIRQTRVLLTLIGGKTAWRDDTL